MPRPRSFRSAEEFRSWLAKEYDRASGLLLRIYKKSAGVPSVTYAEALDQALCFGAYRLQTAKRAETRVRRMKLIIEMLARGEKFH